MAPVEPLQAGELEATDGPTVDGDDYDQPNQPAPPLPE